MTPRQNLRSSMAKRTKKVEGATQRNPCMGCAKQIGQLQWTLCKRKDPDQPCHRCLEHNLECKPTPLALQGRLSHLQSQMYRTHKAEGDPKVSPHLVAETTRFLNRLASYKKQIARRQRDVGMGDVVEELRSIRKALKALLKLKTTKIQKKPVQDAVMSDTTSSVSSGGYDSSTETEDDDDDGSGISFTWSEECNVGVVRGSKEEKKRKLSNGTGVRVSGSEQTVAGIKETSKSK